MPSFYPGGPDDILGGKEDLQIEALRDYLMNHDRQRQHRLVGVLGHQVDRPQALVVAVRLGPAGDPVQHEVGRRHQDDAAGVGVERVLARAERPLPDAALALGDALAVAERVARDVLAGPAVVADDHADVADRHDRLGDRSRPWRTSG